MRRIIHFSALLIVVLFVVGSLLVLKVNNPAQAISATTFQAGRIIDDAVFYNKDAMGGVQDVQNFINNHTPTCDTWGTGPSGYGNLTRAQYATQIKGWHGPPYACLQNYHENPNTGETSFEQGGGEFAGGKSAAQLIWEAAQQYGINPQVLLVMLKKESAGPLFSDSWPLKSQYKYAMGYGCPDSGPGYSANCESSRGGFAKQVGLAAWQLRYYAEHIGDYNYQPGRWNYIQNNPDPNCGGQNVYIENIATASLYIYTPYVPTQAALQAYPGTANCGAYGNRNFYMYFSEWFGSTQADVSIITPLSVTSTRSGRVMANMPTEASFTIQNNRATAISIGGMAVSVRDGQGNNRDYPLENITIPAFGSYRYTKTQTLPAEGQYTFEIVNYSGGVWRNDYPSMKYYSHARSYATTVAMAPTVTTGLSVPQAIHKGETVPVSFVVRNASSSAQNLGKMGVGVRGPSGENLDLGVQDVQLGAGLSKTISFNFTAPSEGRYNFTIISTNDSGATWEDAYPLLGSGTSARQERTALPSAVMISSVAINDQDARTGETATLSFRVKNYASTSVDLARIGLAGRDPQGRNVDPGLVSALLSAGEERTVSLPINFGTEGTYRFDVMGTPDLGRTWTAGPVAETGVQKQLTVTVRPAATVTASLSSSNPTPRVGQTSTLSFTVTNHTNSSVNLGYIGIGGRDPQGRNVDPGAATITLSPNEVRVISFTTAFTTAGQYNYFTLGTQDYANWNTGPALESSALRNTLTQTVAP